MGKIKLIHKATGKEYNLIIECYEEINNIDNKKS